MEKKMHLAIILSIFLFLVVNTTNADPVFPNEPSCKPNKLQPILEFSMQKVLREFGFDNSQNETDLTDAIQDCPPGWLRILDSCYWVSQPSFRLKKENATSFCQTMLPNSRLFEPRSQLQNSVIRELVTGLDGGHKAEYIWLGFNDQQSYDGLFFYDSTNEPIIFANWYQGQPGGGSSQNCVAYDDTEDTKMEWHDVTCTSSYRFICEKPLN